MKVRKDKGGGDGFIKPSFGGGGVGGPKKKRFNQKANNKPKTRKELRKELRKNKKSQKHTFILNRLGKLPPADDSKKKKKRKRTRRNRDIDRGHDGDTREETGPLNTPGYSRKADTTAVKGQRGEDHMELEQLKKEMEYTRKKRLLEENEHEEKVISQLEKRLKLNKKAKVPASFKVDGLDYLLELCERTSSKSKKGSLLKPDYQGEGAKGSEQDDDGSGSEDEMNYSDDGSESDLDGNDDEEEYIDSDESNEDNEDMSDEHQELKEIKEGSESSEDDDHDAFLEAEEMESEDSNDEDLNNPNEDQDEMDLEFEEGHIKQDSIVKENKSKKNKKNPKKKEEFWEDIYGRLRRQDGTVVDEKAISKDEDAVEEQQSKNETSTATLSNSSSSVIVPGKYVPPMKRQNQTQREKISRSLKGLLNRLSEGNMHSIATQIEELYMANSRNEMNECVLELVYALLLRKVVMPERVVLEHVMLIAILHANVGTEIGAFFLQNFVQDFRTKYDATSSLEDNKELENLILLISSMYHFKIVDAGLMYDILNLMAANFSVKDVELILTALRSTGFRLRKDDPLALKSLIILIQKKATEAKSDLSSAKVKFMLDVVMAIRNNNMSKIPNYDPSVGDHLLKMLKSHIHKGNYVSVMKIKMADLLNAETKGRWWIVGSAWSNTGEESNLSGKTDSTTDMTTEEKQNNAKLLSKARGLGMNTETRKNLFCILMTAEDYLDAFEKMSHLDLKNNQEREIIHVTTYCCLHEKKFNPYYGLIASKFCTTDRKFMLTLQYNLWDRLKDLNSLKSYQLRNLAKLLVHFINDRTLPLSTLKVIEYAEMDKAKLKFLKDTLSGILMQKDQENMQEIFMKAAMSEKLNLFRESVKLFMCHFMLQPTVTTSDGEVVGCDLDPKTLQFLKKRIKIAESTMSLGKSRVQL